MAPAKAAGPHRVKFTTSPSRQPKLTPPNEHLPPSASRLDLSFIGKVAHRATGRSQSRQALPSGQHALVSTPTIQLPFRDRRIITAAVQGLTEGAIFGTGSAQEPTPPAPPLAPDMLGASDARSTRACSLSPNRNVGVTNLICGSSLRSHALFADANLRSASLAVRATARIGPESQ